MWVLGNAPDLEFEMKVTTTFSDLSPKVIARYLAGRRGERYSLGYTDCQTVALELERECLEHGGPIHQEVDELHAGIFRDRFYLIVLVALVSLMSLGVWMRRKKQMAASAPALKKPKWTLAWSFDPHRLISVLSKVLNSAACRLTQAQEVSLKADGPRVLEENGKPASESIEVDALDGIDPAMSD